MQTFTPLQMESVMQKVKGLKFISKFSGFIEQLWPIFRKLKEYTHFVLDP